MACISVIDVCLLRWSVSEGWREPGWAEGISAPFMPRLRGGGSRLAQAQGRWSKHDASRTFRFVSGTFLLVKCSYSPARSWVAASWLCSTCSKLIAGTASTLTPSSLPRLVFFPVLAVGSPVSLLLRGVPDWEPPPGRSPAFFVHLFFLQGVDSCLKCSK